ncbi:MAG: hypothetical protein IJX62_08790 [Clostridia bacterium]|nr:hypothetical protein [Clostridia bacterium]
MANNSFTKTYEDLPKIVKIILQLILGAIVGGIYRIIRYTETKNITTLVVGVLAIIPPISFIFWVIDLITEITNNKISVLAD